MSFALTVLIVFRGIIAGIITHDNIIIAGL